MKEDLDEKDLEITDGVASRPKIATDGGISQKKVVSEEDQSEREKPMSNRMGRGGIAISSVYGDDTDPESYERYFFARKTYAGGNHWSIAWSDLMMTMFILFMVMFVYKSADREFLSGEGLGSFDGAVIGREVSPQGQGGANDFNSYGRKAYSKEYGLSRLADFKKDVHEFAQINLAPDNSVRIILTGDLLFPLGGTTLQEGSLDLLKKIAIYLKETPYLINVLGHTDDMPIHGGEGTLSNWELSTNRASAVARYLISEAKLPPQQFSVTGYGEFQPVALNDSPENMAKNRRVEIVITKLWPKTLPLGGADL